MMRRPRHTRTTLCDEPAPDGDPALETAYRLGGLPGFKTAVEAHATAHDLAIVMVRCPCCDHGWVEVPTNATPGYQDPCPTCDGGVVLRAWCTRWGPTPTRTEWRWEAANPTSL